MTFVDMISLTGVPGDVLPFKTILRALTERSITGREMSGVRRLADPDWFFKR